MVLFGALREHPLAVTVGGLVQTKVWARRPSLLFGATTSMLICSLLLGGGTHGGFLSDAILELLAIPLFLILLSSLLSASSGERDRSVPFALTLCLMIAILPLVQLVPLPPAIWQTLPQRDEIRRLFELTGTPPPWLPLSVAPNATWLSALSLLPPMTVFIGVLQLSYRERRELSIVVVIVGIASAIIGLLQVAHGPSSSLRFFEFTNQNEGVGFFANRNHFAALLYVVVLYDAAWATELAITAGSWRNLRSLQSSTLALLTGSLSAIMILIAAETITRSRAGLGLMIVAMFGVFALPLMDRRSAKDSTALKLILAATIVVLLLAVQFTLYRFLERFAADSLQDARSIFAHNTFMAALAYLPFGSGFGSFVSVYPMFEPPKDVLANTFANHAHNDFLEVCLEGGAMAVVLIILFIAWLVLRARQIWRRPPSDVRAIDVLLQRAASIAVCLVMAHSFVDYPLRTDAMMAVFAFCCAFLVEPLGRGGIREPVAANAVPERHRSAPGRQSGAVASAVDYPRKALEGANEASPTAGSSSAGTWGDGIEWPQEWRNSAPASSKDLRPPIGGRAPKRVP